MQRSSSTKVPRRLLLGSALEAVQGSDCGRRQSAVYRSGTPDCRPLNFANSKQILEDRTADKVAESIRSELPVLIIEVTNAREVVRQTNWSAGRTADWSRLSIPKRRLRKP